MKVFLPANVPENALYARYGSSLFCISYLGQLQIISRCRPDYSVRGCAAFRGTNSQLGPQELLPISKGSKVVVSSIFDNLPVRKTSISHAKEIAKITKRITDIALIHPQTAFSITDSSSSKVHARIPRVRPPTSPSQTANLPNLRFPGVAA
jgi:DNA mismatch repair ATPase MutL